MKKYLYETEEWKEMLAEAESKAAAEGGSTGSNMAETYIPPEAHKLWERLPQEKKDEYLSLFRK
jgi:hypothetical protein